MVWMLNVGLEAVAIHHHRRPPTSPLQGLPKTVLLLLPYRPRPMKDINPMLNTNGGFPHYLCPLSPATRGALLLHEQKAVSQRSVHT